MDGSEKTDMVVEEANCEVLSQPKVIVERIQEMDMEKVVVEEVLTEEVVEEVVEEGDVMDQNGQGDGKAPTLNDLIQEAISPDDSKQDGDEAEEGEGAEGEEEGGGDDAADDEDAALAERKKPQPAMDLNQCRCCTGRDDLTDIFGPLKEGTNESRICDNIKRICANVTITKRDHLPHLICKNCLDKLQIALDFKTLCEQTEAEMRKNLPRSKNKSRKGTYTIIDYESSDHEEKDDDGARSEDEDFKLSEEVSSKSSDSDVSFSEKPEPKRRGRKPKSKPIASPIKVAKTASASTYTPSGKPRGRPRKYPVSQTGTTVKKPQAEIVYVDTKAMDSDSDDSDDSDRPPAKRPGPASAKKVVPAPKVSLPPVPKAAPAKTCPKCKGPITRGIHKCQMGFACAFCAEKFPTHAIYMNHQQLHSNFQSVNTCIKCHKKLPSRLELRKHQATPRCQKATKNQCPVCHRTLINASQLAIHLQSKCLSASKTNTTPVAKKPLQATPTKKTTPEDIFKHVAPNSSTYWSDSFSD